MSTTTINFIDDQITIIETAEQGPAGPPGGASFSEGFASQTTPYIVTHNLGRQPGVIVLDTNGIELLVDVQHNSVNQVTLNWDGAITGTVLCGT